MSVLSNTSDYDDNEHDIVAEYESKDSDEDRLNINKNADIDSENSENIRRIDPSTSKKHIVRNPLPKLNTERLKGPKGIHTIEKYFEGFKFHGKGYEKLDLNRIMKRIEHWGHRLFPKLEFDDFLEKLETLGTKKDLRVFVRKYRQDMIDTDDNIINQNDVDIEEGKEQEPIDEFDLLITEQIQKQKQVIQQSSMSDNSISNNNAFDELLLQSTVIKNSQPINTISTSSQLSDEIKERIEKNRQQAIQRRLSRLKEIEETKRKKLESTAVTQFENSTYTMQVLNTDQTSVNEECESNSQILNTNYLS